MNKLIIGLLSITLAACATNHTYQSPAQNYRLQNAENPVSITGKLEQKVNEFSISEPIRSQLSVFIGDELIISGLLDKQVNGELQGKSYQGKPTSASCNTRFVSQNIGETRCLIFINNERTVTLTF